MLSRPSWVLPEWMHSYSWRSACLLSLSCYSDTAKIKERIFWWGIRFREGKWGRVKNSIRDPEKKKFIIKHALPPPKSFEICLQKRWGILICPNLSQKCLPAALSGTKDQAHRSNYLWTSKSPWPSGWTWRKGETGKLRAPVLMV